MKRFLVFSGSDHYPSGGYNDFVGGYETFAEAAHEMVAISHIYGKWVHLVDTELRIMISDTVTKNKLDANFRGWRLDKPDVVLSGPTIRRVYLDLMMYRTLDNPDTEEV